MKSTTLITLGFMLCSIFGFSQESITGLLVSTGTEERNAQFTITNPYQWIQLRGNSENLPFGKVELFINGALKTSYDTDVSTSFTSPKYYFSNGTYTIRLSVEHFDQTPKGPIFSELLKGTDERPSATPTSLYTQDDLGCKTQTNNSVLFKTNNTYELYRWYKNDLIVTTTTTPSTTITVKSGDKISLQGKTLGDDWLFSEKKDYEVNITRQPDQISFTGETLKCYLDDFNLTITTPTIASVKWYNDAALTDQIKLGYTNGGKELKIENNINSDRSFSVYAVGYNLDRSCTTEVKKIDLQARGVPTNPSVSDNAAPYCGTITFTVSGDFIHRTKWYKDANETELIYDSTWKHFDYDLTGLPNGTNRIYYRTYNSVGCEGPLEEIEFQKVSSFGTISTVSETEYCLGEAVNIRLESTTSSSYEWFEDASMNIPAPNQYLYSSTSILSYTPIETGTKTWYYRGNNGLGCYTPLYSVTLRINDKPSNLSITNSEATFCSNESPIFEASGAGINYYEFYRTSNGLLEWGSEYVRGNTLEPHIQNGVNKFWYRAFGNSCETEIKEVTFYVNPAPSKPIQENGENEYCVGETVAITAFSANATEGYEWSYNSSFTNLVEANRIGNTDGSVLSYQATDVGETVFYYRAKTTSCVSETNSLSVTINPQVGPIEVNGADATYCQGETVELIAGATGATTYKWYTNSEGTIPAADITGTNNNTFRLANTTELTPGTYTLYVRGENGEGCNSALKEVRYQVLTTPAEIEAHGQTDYCTGDTVLFTPSATNTHSYQWAYDSNFNNLVENEKLSATAQLNYLATTTENTTYFYRALNTNGCYSQTQSVAIEVLTGVADLRVTNDGITACQGEEISFVATATNAQSYRFYNQDGLQISTSNNLILDTQNLEPKTYDYTLQAFNNNGCSTESLPFSFTIKPVPNTPSLSGETTYCVGETIQLTAESTGANQLRWFTDPLLNNEVTAGLNGEKNQELSVVATSVGQLNYYVVGSTNQPCDSQTQNISITINPQVGPIEVNGADATYCQGETVELIAGATGATTYKWYTNSEGTIPAANITGTNNNTFRLANTTELTPGTYTLYVRGENGEGCNSALKEVTYSILPIPTNLEVIGETEYCLGDTVRLKATSTIGETYKWYFDINQNDEINSTWISSIDGSEIEFIAQTTGPIKLYYKALLTGGCETAVKQTTITVRSKPRQLNVTDNNQVFCSSETEVFEASALDADSFEWYKNPELTLVVEDELVSGFQNNRLTIDMAKLPVADYTYYLIARNNQGCSTASLALNFSVKANPKETSVSGKTTICIGESLEIEAISVGATSFNWFYDSAKNFPVLSTYLFDNGSRISIPAEEEESGYLYVQSVNENGCESEPIRFPYSFHPAPSNLNVSSIDAAACVGSEIEIEVGAENFAKMLWWKDSTGSIPLEEDKIKGTSGNRVLFQTQSSDIGSNSLYVQAINDSGCLTPLTKINYEVFESPGIFSLTSNSENNQFVFGERIELNFDIKNYTQYRILKENKVVLDWQEVPTTSYVLSKFANTSTEGTYTLEISNGSCEDLAEISIYIIDPPEINHDKEDADGSNKEKITVYQGEHVTFSSNIQDDLYIKEWDFGDGFSIVGNPVTHHFNKTGVFVTVLSVINKITEKVIYTTETKITVLDIDNQMVLSDEATDNTEIFFTPNPFKTKLSLNLNLFENNKGSLRIYDLNGLTLFVEQFNAFAGENLFVWNNPLSGSPQGIYMAVLMVGEETTYYKLIKE